MPWCIHRRAGCSQTPSSLRSKCIVSSSHSFRAPNTNYYKQRSQQRQKQPTLTLNGLPSEQTHSQRRPISCRSTRGAAFTCTTPPRILLLLWSATSEEQRASAASGNSSTQFLAVVLDRFPKKYPDMPRLARKYAFKMTTDFFRGLDATAKTNSVSRILKQPPFHSSGPAEAILRPDPFALTLTT